MPHVSELRQKVMDDFGEANSLALQIYDTLTTKLAPGAAKYITIPWLQQYVPAEIEDLYDVITYFCGQSLHLLSSHYELVRDDDSLTELDAADVFAALRGAPLFDPETGEPVGEWVKRVAPSFRGTQLLQQLVGEHAT